MRKLLQITLLSMLLTGCAGPVKQSWNNFTAYYNTYYNAKQYFSEGEELNLAQSEPINPSEPIRIFQSPSEAGYEQLDETIIRAASILRNHDQSRYVIPSLLLIGKSYYYKSEFFAALEKFREAGALARGPDYGEAVFWQARTLYEMGDIDEGVRLISSELENLSDLPSDLTGRLYAINAQLLAEREEWAQASQSLLLAEQYLDDSFLKARTYFFHGQVLEQTRNVFQARAAYALASELKSDYDIEFHSRKKQADLARLSGEYESALKQFRSLERDDKFSEYRIEMRYEAARTHQEMGNVDRAIELYNSILHNRFEMPESVVKAKSYFGLGEIYRDNLDNFAEAAAYFDSSASQNISPDMISAEFDASELADTFGEYSRLKNRIAEKDSLLRLAKLDPAQLDSVIAVMSADLAEEQLVLQSETERSNVMMLSDSENDGTAEAAESAEYGFLNHMNPSMLADASMRFQATWGDRPLEDNWRRNAVVSGSRYDHLVSVDTETDQTLQNGEAGLPPDAVPDLSAIPFEEDQQNEIQREIEDDKYRLANLFLLRLNMPDSARTYYQDILQSGLNESLLPRTLFSLIDLELATGNEDNARVLADRLIEEYPESPYTVRVLDRLDIERMQPISFALADSNEGIEASYQAIQQSDTAYSAADEAMLLQSLAQESGNSAQSELLYYEAARNYMKEAIAESDDPDSVYEKISEKLLSEMQQRELTVLKDSATVMLQDKALPDNEHKKWEAIADSTINMENDVEYTFEGAYWDSTRSMLNRAASLNRSGQIASKTRALLVLLKQPGTSDADTVRSMEFPRDRFPTDPGPDMNRCTDAGLIPDVEGGIQGFMSRVQFPDWAYGSGLNTEITYLITVTSEGEVTDYEQVTSIDRSGIPQAVEEAIERELKFEPLEGTDMYRCEITFPIEL